LIYDFPADATVELFAQLHFFRPKQPRPLYAISKVVRNYAAGCPPDFSQRMFDPLNIYPE
jgi:hypothetical protein